MAEAWECGDGGACRHRRPRVRRRRVLAAGGQDSEPSRRARRLDRKTDPELASFRAGLRRAAEPLKRPLRRPLAAEKLGSDPNFSRQAVGRCGRWPTCR